jgi:hypothetical protein
MSGDSKKSQGSSIYFGNHHNLMVVGYIKGYVYCKDLIAITNAD